MVAEGVLKRNLFSNFQERTFVDKVLAREDVNEIKELIQKPHLERTDVLKMLYLISGTESKLLNLNEWDRYIQLKFFVWIREFVKIAELLWDYEDALSISESTCSLCKLIIGVKCQCKEPVPLGNLTDRTKKLLKNNALLIQHNTKFLVDLYLNIGRTTMSLGGTGFTELLKNKFEVTYPLGSGLQQTDQQRTGIMGMGRRK